MRKKAFSPLAEGAQTIYVLAVVVFVSFSRCGAIFTSTGTYGPHRAPTATFIETRTTMGLPYSSSLEIMDLGLFTFEVHCSIRNAASVAQQKLLFADVVSVIS